MTIEILDAATGPAKSLIVCMRDDLRSSRGDLPVIPRTAREALRLASNPSVNLRSVVEVAEKDPPLAARFLAVANSPLYFRGVGITSIHAAVTRLGTQAVRDLLYMSVYSGLVFRVPEYQSIVESVFEHSILTARMARRLADHSTLGISPEEAFLAGLLHDVGRARCLKLAAKYERELSPPLVEVLAITDELHEEAGADIAEAWSLPVSVGEACRFHHHPAGNTVGTLIGAADLLAHATTDEGADIEERLPASLVAVGISPSIIPAFLGDARDDAEALGALGGLDAGDH